MKREGFPRNCFERTALKRILRNVFRFAALVVEHKKHKIKSKITLNDSFYSALAPFWKVFLFDFLHTRYSFNFNSIIIIIIIIRFRLLLVHNRIRSKYHVANPSKAFHGSFSIILLSLLSSNPIYILGRHCSANVSPARIVCFLPIYKDWFSLLSTFKAFHNQKSCFFRFYSLPTRGRVESLATKTREKSSSNWKRCSLDQFYGQFLVKSLIKNIFNFCEAA